MSLPNILLGMLVQPASGYDLKQEFELQQAHYWSANLAQIYPTLKRMEADGLLESEEQPSDKGPPRKVYRRTAAGRAALVEWLQRGPEVHTDRLSWLAQVGFLAELNSAGQVEFLQQLRSEFLQHREQLAGIERYWAEQDPAFPDALAPPDRFAYMTLRLGLKKYAAIIEWCDECLGVLGAANASVKGSGHGTVRGNLVEIGGIEP